MVTLFWTVFFCLGLYKITEDGQLLSFLKAPFNDIDLNHDKEKIELAMKFDKSSVDALKKTLLKHKLIYYIGKPLVMCITCMASIWGITVFVALNGLHEDLIFPLILNCVSASFIQTLIWRFYERYIQ